MKTTHDAIVIGSGQAGPSLAVRLTKAGMNVVLVEREHYGGTCVNDGCIPTKTLVASARAAYVARRASRWGVTIEGRIAVDMKAVKARKDRVVQQSVDYLKKWLGSTPGIELIEGHARFVAPHEVQVGERVLAAPKIFINTGGRPVLPSWPGIEQVDVLTNTTMMDVDFLPEHLIVAGGSYIGLEFAQMYRRFGAQVTVLEVAPRLVAREDAEVSAEVRAMLEAEGVTIHCSVQDVRVERAPGAGRAPPAPNGDSSRPAEPDLEHDGDGVRIDFAAGGTAHSVRGSHLLAAVGRRPNTDDLGLDKAGIATDARGFVKVDDELRTNVPGVWALGDVHGRGAFTHTSYNDYEIVAANLLDGEQRRLTDRITAYALFTDPPLGRVGMSEAEVRASGRNALVGVMPMTRVGRAKERGETRGFMKVFVDADSEQILGAALLCIEGDEIVHSLLDAMAAGASYRTIRRTVHIHPTVSELIPTLLGQLVPLEKSPQ